MDTFKTTPEQIKFILTTKNHKAAQNVECILCGEKWKDHFAGKSNTITQGACLKGLDVVYSE